MKTIGVLARTGGAGKSTLTLHWAVEAERQGRGKVAVIDMDPQQTSVKWLKRRLMLGKQTPAMLVAEGGDLKDVFETCNESGMGLVLIDTPPHVEAPCREAAKLADVMVIPWEPSAPDLEAICPVLTYGA